MLPTSLDLDPSAIPISQIPAALSALAALHSALAARLMIAPAAAPASDVDKGNLLTVRECAQRLRRSTKRVYQRTKTLPFGPCAKARKNLDGSRPPRLHLCKRNGLSMMGAIAAHLGRVGRSESTVELPDGIEFPPDHRLSESAAFKAKLNGYALETEKTPALHF